MCGIIGYKGKQDASLIAIDGLKTLEYRGYDSWGIALKQRTGALYSLKRVGKIGDFQQEKKLPHSNIAIAHTRWATHGNVTEENAHPQFSSDNGIAVVHNGIIENYQELRKWLEAKGHKFISQTDTEVIPHLIEEYCKEQDFDSAVKSALNRLEGSFAVVIINKFNDQLIGARRGSPLVLGIGQGEYFLASDVPAFIEHTKDVIFLDDGELIIINSDYEIISLKTNRAVKKEICHVDLNIEQAKKGKYKHFMLKEISEQEEAILKSINQEKEKVEMFAREIRKAKKVFFVAGGTSYHAGLAACYLFSRIAKKQIQVIVASEFSEYKCFLDEKTLVIPISQSGETADVLEAVKEAKSRKAKIISIVNVMGSSLMRMSDSCFMINAGPEICVLATKSFTAQISLLTLVAYAYAGKLEEGKKVLRNAALNVSEMLKPDYMKKIENLAEKIKASRSIFTIGRGLNYPTALEAALKIKEVSYIHAEGFAGGELKHGPIALIEKGIPCIAFVSNDEHKKEMISNAIEVRSRGGFMIGVSYEDNEVFDAWLKVPDAGNASPIVGVIPCQMLAYFLAVNLGYDPDKPRNLAKSVTVK